LERREGFGVVLTGFGGDEWLNGSSFILADMIWSGRFTDLFHDLRDHSRARALNPGAVTRPTCRYFLTFGLIPALSRLLPGPLRTNLKKYLRAVKADPLFVPEFSRRTNQYRRASAAFASAPGDSFVQRSICRPLVEGWSSYGLEMDERAMAPYGIEQRHPFYNRRIIEFCYGIPEDQRQRGPIKKYVLRKALGDLLPRAVRDRQSKAEFSDTFVKALETVGGEQAFHTLSPMVRRWINPEQAVAMYRKMTELVKKQDANYKVFASRLWSVVAVDIWCEAVFG
jgi:asparagine synthase (glutamine-hydrolysing)